MRTPVASEARGVPRSHIYLLDVKPGEVVLLENCRFNKGEKKNDDALAKQLTEASSRVSAVGRAYERLAYDENVETIALDAYLKHVCVDAIPASSNCQLDYTADADIRVDARLRPNGFAP